jgi:hypothetical protein
MRTRAISISCLPARTRSALAVASPARTRLDHLRDGEAVRQHDRFSACLLRAAVGEQTRERGGGGRASRRRRTRRNLSDVAITVAVIANVSWLSLGRFPRDILMQGVPDFIDLNTEI